MPASTAGDPGRGAAAALGVRRPGRGRRRAVPAVGDRGRLPRRAARPGSGRRGAHRRRRPWERLKLRGLNGVHSRHGLPRRAGRPRDHRRGAAPARPGRAAAPVHRRGRGRPASPRPTGSAVVGYGEQVLARFANPAIAAPHPAGGDGRLAEAAAAGAAHHRRPARAGRPAPGARWSWRPGCGSSRAAPTTAGRCRWTTRPPRRSGPRVPRSCSALVGLLPVFADATPAQVARVGRGAARRHGAAEVVRAVAREVG